MRKNTAPLTVRPGHSVLWEEHLAEVRGKAGAPELNAGAILRTALFVLAAMGGEELRAALSLSFKAELDARQDSAA